MKKPPTFIDAVIGETFRKKSYVPAAFRPRLLNARKFVLDYSMSAYLSDLTNAAFTANPGRAPEIVDGARLLARLPHRTTWIEYDAIARRRRLRAAYLSSSSPVESISSGRFAHEDEVIPRIGWLLEQHATMDNAFLMTEFCGAIPGDKIEPHIYALPHSYVWTSTNEIPPWPTLGWTNPEDIKDGIPPGSHLARQSEIATGIVNYNCKSVGIIQTPGTREATAAIIKETAGELRAAWTLLATINDLPVTYDSVRPSKGYIAKGQYRKYSQHSVITLHVPERRLKTIAARAVAKIRRIAHPVRGHWRKDWRNPATPLCEHDWTAVDDHIRCTKCHGQRLWISEHIRGDAGIGFRSHDYQVVHAT